MNVLRALALQSADPNCIVLGEQEITQYLQSPKASAQKLREIIDREAKISPQYATFWTTMQEFAGRLREK